MAKRNYLRPRTEADKPCSIDGCEYPFYAKGYCLHHYLRNKKYGDPLAAKAPRIYPKAPPQTEKKCCGCGKIKSANHFWRTTTDRLIHRCKMCMSAYNAGQRVKHIGKRIAAQRAYFKAAGIVSGWDRGRDKWDISEPEKYDGYLRRTYGIGIADYGAMLKKQGGVCAICKDACNRKTTKRLCVDHNHETGAVRGLLCFQCNVGIGKFKEDATNLRAAIKYLEAAEGEVLPRRKNKRAA